MSLGAFSIPTAVCNSQKRRKTDQKPYRIDCRDMLLGVRDWQVKTPSSTY